MFCFLETFFTRSRVIIFGCTFLSVLFKGAVNCYDCIVEATD
jgi:hypothetical protein